jgi:hypothetical protein
MVREGIWLYFWGDDRKGSGRVIGLFPIDSAKDFCRESKIRIKKLLSPKIGTRWEWGW